MPSTLVDPEVEAVDARVRVLVPVQAADVRAAAKKIPMAYPIVGGKRINNKLFEECEV